MNAANYRKTLFDLFADPDTTVEGKVTEALTVGTEYLDLPIGFLTRIQNNIQEIVHAVGDHALIQPGETCPLDDAYCRRTVEIESPLAVANAAVSPAIAETAIETFDLGTYIGAKVTVNDATYGTVCFAADTQRDTAFTEAETYFVELLARLIGQAFERQSYEQQLAEREAELDDREEIYRTIINASFDLVFRIDPAGEFTFLSQAVEQLLGYPPDHYVGQSFTAMLPDAETVEVAQELFERVMAGETIEEYYFPLEDTTGDRVFVDIRVTPIYESGLDPEERTPDAIVGVQGTARDATDRYRRQRLISVLNRVLRHNLRNDMNVISGYARTLCDRLSGEEASFAERIQTTSEGLTRLSETARTLEENLEDPPEASEGDIVPYVRQAVDQISDRYPAASVQLTCPEQAVARSAPRVETAVLEVLDNAVKHSGEEGSVRIDVTTGKQTVDVVVEDEGPGLPEHERDVLMSGEETPLVHGSGLGLWLVYWIIESVDGEIQVEERNTGTSIRMRLQRCQ